MAALQELVETLSKVGAVGKQFEDLFQDVMVVEEDDIFKSLCWWMTTLKSLISVAIGAASNTGINGVPEVVAGMDANKLIGLSGHLANINFDQDSLGLVLESMTQTGVGLEEAKKFVTSLFDLAKITLRNVVGTIKALLPEADDAAGIPVTVEHLKNFNMDEDTMEPPDMAQQVRDMDRSTLDGTHDKRVGLTKALASLSREAQDVEADAAAAGGSSESLSLRVDAAKAFKEILTFIDEDSITKKFSLHSALTHSIQAFQDSVAEDKHMRILGNDVATGLLCIIAEWLKSAEGKLDEHLQSIIKQMQDIHEGVKPFLLDLKPVMRKFKDEDVQSIIDMNGRPELIDAIKKLNIAISKWRAVSSLVVGCMDKVSAMNKHFEDLITVRNDARKLISVRTGLIILKKEKKGDVVNFLKDCKKLHVKLPKPLKDRLDKLIPDGVESESEDPRPEVPAEADAADDE